MIATGFGGLSPWGHRKVGQNSKPPNESLAQLAEQLPLKEKVVGSLPTGLTELLRYVAIQHGSSVAY